MKNIEDKVMIYLIDDDEFFLKIINNKFKAVTHFHLMTFTTPQSFLEYLKHSKIPKNFIQIGILDYYFLNKFDEQMDGIETMDEIKKLNPEINIILVSQRNDGELISKAKEHGAFNFIPKSEDAFMRILNQVRWLVGNHAVQLTERRKRRAQYIFLFLFIIGFFTFIYHKIF